MAILALADSRADLRRRLGRDRRRLHLEGHGGTRRGPQGRRADDGAAERSADAEPGADHRGRAGDRALRAVRQHRARHEQRARAADGPAARRLTSSTRPASPPISGAEKFFDLVMPMCGHVPSVAVVIVTLKALRAQGGATDGTGPVEKGFPNLAAASREPAALGRADRSSRSIGFPATPTKISNACAPTACRSASRRRLSEGYARGGDGMTDLADKVVRGRHRVRHRRGEAALRPRSYRSRPRSREIATKVYGAERVSFKPAAQRAAAAVCSARLRRRCPVCIAKTQYSFTDDPKLMGAPLGLDAERHGRDAVGRRRLRRRHCRQHDADAGPGKDAAGPQTGCRRPGQRRRDGLLIDPCRFCRPTIVNTMNGARGSHTRGDSSDRRVPLCLTTSCCSTIPEPCRLSMSPAEMQAVIQRYVAWRQRVQQGGRAVSGHKLATARAG